MCIGELRLLGGWLAEAGRFHEIGEVFGQIELFADVLMKNPQYLLRKPLHSKMDQWVTNIVLAIVVSKWGILNLDLTFCNVVAQCLRNHGILMPKRGAAGDRDWAKSLQYKASSIRNHPTYYVSKLRVRSADMTDVAKLLVMKGCTAITCVDNDVSIFSEAHIKAQRAKLDELKETFLTVSTSPCPCSLAPMLPLLTCRAPCPSPSLTL